jgi:hypothetical protein
MCRPSINACTMLASMCDLSLTTSCTCDQSSQNFSECLSPPNTKGHPPHLNANAL